MPELDALGALGDVGWYCSRSILWVADYELPKKAVAIHGAVKTEAGVILSCGSSLLWEDSKVATFQCSFLTHLTMRGSLQLSDFVTPLRGGESSILIFFRLSLQWVLVTGWQSLPTKHIVPTDLPQVSLMVQLFSRLAGSIGDSAGKPDDQWPAITRNRQLVLNAVKASIDQGCVPVEIV